MEASRVAPETEYRTKLFVAAALGYGIPAIAILIIFILVSLAKGIGFTERPFRIFWAVFGGAGGVTWILLVLLIPPYFRSISYELTDSEIVVRKGIFTKVVKTVPYRTITNIVESRDLLDRYIVNLGSVNIQTAGKSGEVAYEARLAGLGDWEAVHQLILAKLRSFRGGMAATTTEVGPDSQSVDLLRQILAELEAIRASLGGRG